MKIGVRISELMTLRGENRLLRIPQDARDMYQVNPYRYLHSSGHNGSQMILKSWVAYGADTIRDSTVCYVSEAVYKLLDVDTGGEIDITQVQNITLGCDPEFFVVNGVTNEIIFASIIFPSKYGDVGYDGMMCELRPMPALSEHVVCKNLWDLFKKARTIVNNYCVRNGVNPEVLRFLGTSYLALAKKNGFSAGFHLHYGLPQELLGNVGWQHPKRLLAKQITKILDYYVGIPSIIVEDSTEVTRRSNPYIEYGKPGAFRMDNRTLEYRTPGAAMLRHPVLAAGLMGLGALVMEDLVIKVSAWTNSFTTIDQLVKADIRDCYPNIPKNPQEIFGTICSSSNTPAMGHLEKIANDLSNMVGFEQRRDSVEKLLNCLTNGVEFNKDIEINWRKYYDEEQPRTVGVFQQPG